MTITYKDAAGIAGMRVAGKLASEVLDYLTPFVQAGVTTNALDQLAHDYIVDVQGGIPAPLNYKGGGNTPYPKSICTSVNHQVCQGFSVVREFCGHGIGRVFHEEPQVLHYGRPGTLEKLVEGMTFTIEPMINAGRKEIKDGPEKDGWTIVTQDRSLSAQWEHTVLVTPTGYEVLTLSEGSPATPAFVTAAQSQPA